MNLKTVIEKETKKDTLFSFDIEDLTPVIYAAETLSYRELRDFIDKEEKRGSSNIGRYQLVLYQKMEFTSFSIYFNYYCSCCVVYKKARWYGC